MGLTGKGWMARQGIHTEVLVIGNLLLFLVSLVAYQITFRSLNSANPQAFVRAMYGSFMIKFFLIAIAAFAYIMAAKQNVNKPALLVCGALYIIYTAVEIKALLQLLKQKKNG
ncbi:MAG: hypothetical protein HYZ15_09335 [Sphingobacteriales bacterium]|nr:hypothetical protein [Sphingobacteriales bacterium]